MIMLTEDFLIQLLDKMNIGLTFLNEKGEIAYCNSYAERLFGYREKGLFGSSVLDCHQTAIHNQVMNKLEKLKTGNCGGWHRIIERGNCYLENYYNSVYMQNEYKGIIIASKDITEREVLSRALEQSLQELTVLFEAVQIVNSSLDVAHVLENIVQLAQPVIGFDGGGILLVDKTTGEPAHETCYNCTADRLMEISRNSNRNNNQETLLTVPVRVNNEISGLWYVENYSGQIFKKDQKEMLEALANLTGTAVKNAWLYEKTKRQATVDTLTGLYNRQYFDHVFGIEKERVKLSGGKLSLLMVDANRLKHINDHFGHETGDYIIKEAAALIKESVRKEELVFRYGGDEMILLLPGSNARAAKSVVDRIRGKVDRWNSFQGKGDLYLSLSIGYATACNEKQLETLLKDADEAMYRDKQVFYDSIREHKDNYYRA